MPRRVATTIFPTTSELWLTSYNNPENQGTPICQDGSLLKSFQQPQSSDWLLQCCAVVALPWKNFQRKTISLSIGFARDSLLSTTNCHLLPTGSDVHHPYHVVRQGGYPPDGQNLQGNIWPSRHHSKKVIVSWRSWKITFWPRDSLWKGSSMEPNHVVSCQ